MRASFRQNLSLKRGICREAEAIQRRAGCGGVKAGQSGSSARGVDPAGWDFRTDYLSVKEAIRWIGGRPGSSAQATSGREHSVEAIGRRPNARQSLVAGYAIKNILEASRCRQVVDYLHGSYRVSEGRACRVTRLNRGTFRYRSHKDPRTALRMRIREIAQTGVRYGYRKIRVLLNREGWKVGKYLVEPLSGRGINAAPATETPAATG